MRLFDDVLELEQKPIFEFVLHAYKYDEMTKGGSALGRSTACSTSASSIAVTKSRVGMILIASSSLRGSFAAIYVRKCAESSMLMLIAAEC